jgi:hypothetical protein
MEHNAILKKMIKGKPRMRWLEKMRDREQWRLAIEEARAHPGL